MISIIIPTYNPNLNRLNKTLDGLKRQDLPLTEWELIIIDNNSNNYFTGQLNLSWQPNSKIVVEKKQGLTYARIKGFEVAIGDIIVLVDDDNILDKYYLSLAKSLMLTHKDWGAIGGKSIPQFESTEPSYLKKFYGCLALRDLGSEILTAKWDNSYPTFSPIGAGMIIQTAALEPYIHKIKTTGAAITDRTGNDLSSGGDNDIVIEILKQGYTVAYHPQLSLQHIIPENRTKVAYLSRLVYDSNVSWVKLLASHQINPWFSISKYTLQLRYFKAYITYKAWQNPENHINWKSACGLFKGLSEIE